MDIAHRRFLAAWLALHKGARESDSAVRFPKANPNRADKGQSMTNAIKAKIKKTTAVLALLPLLAVLHPGFAAQNQPANDTKGNGKVVYVCACLKNKSCSCMTEAKTEGPCSCGTAGGPPMKAVPQNGAWAKANREALAN
jgi:hypothetical protein